MTERSQRSEQSRTVSDVVVERLQAWGVQRLYGYSGDGINGLLEAVRRSDAGFEFIQPRHEENGAFMAVAEAKYNGGIGVMISTQGPGAVHLLNGLYDAKLDHVPVVALIGQQDRTVLGSGYMQEINLRTLFSDVAAAYIAEVTSPEQVPMVIDRAFRKAQAAHAPTVVILPHDLQSAPAPELPAEHGIVHTSPTFSAPVVRAPDEKLHEAAQLLSAARKPALLVGRGVAAAAKAVESFARQTNAAVVTSLLGKPYVDETLPFAAGTMGHLGTTASAQVFAQCDMLLIVGSDDPWTEFYPKPGKARVVQIDIDPSAIGNRVPVDVALTGDARATLEALLELVTPATDTAQWREQVEQWVRQWHEVSAARAEIAAEPLNPEAVVRALNSRLPEDVRVAVDVGSIVYWYARQLILPAGVPAHLSSTLASMGCGLPYGLAAKISADERPVVVLTGDGGMQMTGLAELATLAHRWRDWADPRFVVAVLDNRDLAEVSWEQREKETAPRYPESQELPAVPYDEYARVLGLAGESVTSPDEIGPAWDRAWAAERPYVIAFRTDPAIPLLPPLAAAGDTVDGMRTALEAEKTAGGVYADRALRLLEQYVAIEEDAGAAGG